MAATVAVVGSVVTFTGDAGEEAIARSEVTTTEEDDAVSFSFQVTRQALTLRVGSTAGGQEIVENVQFAPGYHVVTFTPAVTTYYVEFSLEGALTATLENFQRIAPGDLQLTTPWNMTVVPSLRQDQSLNTIFFAGGGVEPYVLERRGLQSWSLRPYRPSTGPFAPLNLTSTTLTPAARTGTTTVTASRALFGSYDVGALIRLTHTGQYKIEDLSSAEDATEAIRVTGVGVSRGFSFAISDTFSGTVSLEASVGNEVSFQIVESYTSIGTYTFNDENDNQIIYYRLRMSAYTSGSATASLTYSAGVTDGIARIVSVDADNEVTVDVIEPFGLASATPLWYFGAWSGRFGYPDAVTLHDGRLWYGRGNQYWASGSDDFADFDIGPLGDQAMSRTFSGRMGRVRWMSGGLHLLAGLSGFESQIGSTTFREVIIPENVRSDNHKRRGSADANPILVDDSPVFISRTRKRLYRFNPEDEVKLLDLTRLHRRIGGNTGFRELAFQQEPEPRIWAVREDGEVAGMVFDVDERVFAFFRLVFDGDVESVCVVPNPTSEQDDVIFTIKRTIGEATVRYHEQLADERWTSISDAWRLHSALEYSGSATTSLTGLGHLEGKSVYVWGDGRQSGPYTVTSGAITLSYAVEYAIVGLQYDGLYKGPRMNWMNPSLSEYKQLRKLGMILSQTAGGNIEWGDRFSEAGDDILMSKLEDRRSDSGLAFDSEVQLWNEPVVEEVETESARDLRLHIRMRGAGPVTVLGLIPDVTINSG